MNRFASVTRPLMWFMAFMLAALTAGCGGGSGGGAPILGLPGVISLTVTPATATIPITGTQQFTAIETYSDGSSRDVTATSTWTSGIPAVAANPIAGLATGLTAGITPITATSGGRTATPATLTVSTATHVSLVVTPTTATIPVGGIQQYAAIETFSDGTIIDRTVTSAAGTTVWSTSGVNAARATVCTGIVTATCLVTDFGKATGVTDTTVTLPTGPVFINATFTPVGGATLTAIPATLIVNTATSVSFVVTPVAPTISVGGVQKFVATETFSDGSSFDRTAASVWTSANVPAGGPAVATFLADGAVTGGIATGNVVGTSAITATYTVGLVVKISPLYPAASGALLTVVAIAPLPVVSIIVTPPAASILVGGKYQFTATATYSDGTSTNVTADPGTLWSLGNAFATPTGIPGEYTGLLAGTLPITAAFGTKTSPLSPAPGGALLTVTGAPPLVCGSAGAPPCLLTVTPYGILALNKISETSAGPNHSHIYGDVALTESALNGGTIASVTGLGLNDVPGAPVKSTGVTNFIGSVNPGVVDAANNGPLTAPQLAQVLTDLQGVYTDLMNRQVAVLAPALVAPGAVPASGGVFAPGQDLTGWVLGPGVYTQTGAYGLSKTKGALVLDAGGNPDAVFVIGSTSAASGFTSTDGSIVLQGKAQAKNVFWVMKSAATIGIGTFFQGTLVAGNAITVLQFANVQGRMLAGAAPLAAAGALTLTDTNIVTVPQ